MNDLEAGRPGKNKSAEDHSHKAKTARDTVNVKSAPGAASVVQIETLGRHGIFVLWISAFIGAASLVTALAFAFWIDRVSARVYVLEYDAGRICAQLLEEEIVEACH